MAKTRVGILGCGIVGSAVARRLTSADAPRHLANLQLTHIVDRRADEKRVALDLPSSVVWAQSIDRLLQSDVDVVVEAIGGLEPAGSLVRDALNAGKSVVTANKQLVAHHGAALWTLAARQGRQFRFEAAVGGAMPIVRAIGDALSGDRIRRIVAILNGTTNDVLSRIDATGCSLEDALVAARRSGYAERDASADLDGDDARAKLAILCALAFGVRVDPRTIPAHPSAGVDAAAFHAARLRGATIRQLAHAVFDRRRSELTAWVAPVLVARDSLFGRTTGPGNAAIVTGEFSGEISISGTGAGGDATAVAVLSDIAAIARDRAAIVPPPSLTTDFTFQTSDFQTDVAVPTSDFSLAEAV